MTGHALAASAQLAALVEPASQSVEDDNLVPESAFGIDRPHSRHGQVKRRQIIVDIGFIPILRLTDRRLPNRGE